VYFFPLATTLQNPSLRALGVLLIVVAAAALGVGLASGPMTLGARLDAGLAPLGPAGDPRGCSLRSAGKA
jgi:hypothetical protein